MEINSCKVNRHEPINSRSKPGYFLQVAIVIVGAVMGTISVCGVISTIWGAVGWVSSIVSLIRLLAVSRRTNVPKSPPSSIVARVAFASVAVFCLIFLAAMWTAFNGDPQALGQAEQVAFWILIVIGAASATAAMRMVWE